MVTAITKLLGIGKTILCRKLKAFNCGHEAET